MDQNNIRKASTYTYNIVLRPQERDETIKFSQFKKISGISKKLHYAKSIKLYPNSYASQIPYARYNILVHKIQRFKHQRPSKLLVIHGPTNLVLISATICNIKQYPTQNKIITEEQKGRRKQSQGCKYQLIMDSVIMEQAKKITETFILVTLIIKKNI